MAGGARSTGNLLTAFLEVTQHPHLRWNHSNSQIKVQPLFLLPALGNHLLGGSQPSFVFFSTCSSQPHLSPWTGQSTGGEASTFEIQRTYNLPKSLYFLSRCREDPLEVPSFSLFNSANFLREMFFISFMLTQQTSWERCFLFLSCDHKSQRDIENKVIL